MNCNAKNIFILFCFLYIPLLSLAQKEASVWYFGSNSGINFSNGSPIGILGSALNTLEGCATICDKNGELLFYTNGKWVFNKKHEIMLNGKDLHGDFSTSQSAIIIPKPSDSNLFYVFTGDSKFNQLKNGISYTTVDMRLDSGKGAVTLKNEQLHTPSTEKITAVRHSNGVDVWVITHKYGNNEFLVYKVSKQGVERQPIVSSVGTVHSALDYDGSQGYMKVSPKGDKIAVAISTEDILEVLDFDNTTGKVSNPIKSPYYLESIYGVEFSPDGSKLYASVEFSKVIQLDLNSTNIFSSYNEVKEVKGHRVGALQLGLDNKVYITATGKKHLDVINEPNKVGNACNYEENKVSLKGQTAAYGLPNFIQSYFYPKELTCGFTYEGNCIDDNFNFYGITNDSLATFSWDFGINSTLGDTALGDSVSFNYDSKGMYTPKLIVELGNEKCEIQKPITVLGKPEIILPRDTFVCQGQSLILTPISYDGKINWSTSAKDTLSTITVDTAGVFIATNTNSCGIAKDTIEISYKRLPVISIQTETVVCPNVPFSASLQSDHKVVEWHDGKFIYNRTFNIQGTSIFWVKSTNICGTSYDSVTVNVYPQLQFQMNADSAVCPDVDFKLSATSNSDSTINWFNTTTGESTNTKLPSSQWVWAVTKNQCETKYDSLFIETYPPTKIELGKDQEICDNNILLDAGIDGAEYKWQDIPSYNERTFTATKPGTYKVAVTRCQKTVIDSIIVNPPQDTSVYIPNAFTPNGDLLNDSFTVFIGGFAPQKYQLYIYSRWGEEVFRSENHLRNWDGTYETEDAPEGIYLYMLNLLHCNRIKTYKGSITLMR